MISSQSVGRNASTRARSALRRRARSGLTAVAGGLTVVLMVSVGVAGAAVRPSAPAANHSSGAPQNPSAA